MKAKNTPSRHLKRTVYVIFILDKLNNLTLQIFPNAMETSLKDLNRFLLCSSFLFYLGSVNFLIDWLIKPVDITALLLCFCNHSNCSWTRELVVKILLITFRMIKWKNDLFNMMDEYCFMFSYVLNHHWSMNKQTIPFFFIQRWRNLSWITKSFYWTFFKDSSTVTEKDQPYYFFFFASGYLERCGWFYL